MCFLLFAAMLAFHRRLVIDEPDAPPAADPVSETTSNPAAEAPAAEPTAALA